MSIFNLQEDEAEVVAFLERELGKAFEAFLPMIETMLDAKLQLASQGIESWAETRFSEMLAQQLGVSRELVTKSLNDVFTGKIQALPGDIIEGIKQELHL